MGVGIVVIEVVRHCLDNRRRNLGAPGTVEVGYEAAPVTAGERRKTGSELSQAGGWLPRGS